VIFQYTFRAKEKNQGWNRKHLQNQKWKSTYNKCDSLTTVRSWRFLVIFWFGKNYCFCIS